MPQFSDDIFLGPAVAGGAGMGESAAGPSFMPVGLGPIGRVFVYDIVPLTLQAGSLAANQTTAGAANLVLTAGTGVTTRIVNGVTRFVLDVARTVSIQSAGNFAAVTFTVSGFDIYGQALTQTLLGPNNSTVNTLKALKEVVSIAASAILGTNTQAGVGDTFGLPIRLLDIGHLISVKWAQTLAADAGTPVIAVATSPSTAALGDVRGTYLPSSASNGVRRLVVTMFTPAIAAGPNANRVGAFGVAQV